MGKDTSRIETEIMLFFTDLAASLDSDDYIQLCCDLADTFEAAAAARADQVEIEKQRQD